MLRNKKMLFAVCVMTLLTGSIKLTHNHIIHAKNKPIVIKTNLKKRKMKKIKPSYKNGVLEYWSKITGKKVVGVKEIYARLSFYTSLDCENGFGAITSTGARLRDGIIANNMYPIGTNIHFKGYGHYQVLDRGGSGFNNYNSFDVFVPRNYGESDSQYYNRVNNLGIKQVKGYILDFSK